MFLHVKETLCIKSVPTTPKTRKITLVTTIQTVRTFPMVGGDVGEILGRVGSFSKCCFKTRLALDLAIGDHRRCFYMPRRHSGSNMYLQLPKPTE